MDRRESYNNQAGTFLFVPFMDTIIIQDLLGLDEHCRNTNLRDICWVSILLMR